MIAFSFVVASWITLYDESRENCSFSLSVTLVITLWGFSKRANQKQSADNKLGN